MKTWDKCTMKDLAELGLHQEWASELGVGSRMQKLSDPCKYGKRMLDNDNKPEKDGGSAGLMHEAHTMIEHTTFGWRFC